MRAKAVIVLASAIFGGLLVGAFWFFHSLKTEYHYHEVETFFRGTVRGKEVLGISYFDYHGIGIMEGNQWKILLRDASGQDVTVYQNRPVFQERIPYQPKIEIKGTDIFIDDGENKFSVGVNQ